MRKIVLALAAVAALGLGAWASQARADHGRGWGGGWSGGYGGYYGRSYRPSYYDGCYGGYGRYGGYHHHHRHYHRGYYGDGLYLRSPGFGIYLGF